MSVLYCYNQSKTEKVGTLGKELTPSRDAGEFLIQSFPWTRTRFEELLDDVISKPELSQKLLLNTLRKYPKSLWTYLQLLLDRALAKMAGEESNPRLSLTWFISLEAFHTN